MSVASPSTPARASWREPSQEVCSSPELLKISCPVPELIFKITASTNSKGFPASADSSRRAPDSTRQRPLRFTAILALRKDKKKSQVTRCGGQLCDQ